MVLLRDRRRGFVRRQVTLEGPHREVNVACSLQEWEDAYRADTTEEYHETYGLPDEWSTRSPAWGHHDLKPLTRSQFEDHSRDEAISRSPSDPLVRAAWARAVGGKGHGVGWK